MIERLHGTNILGEARRIAPDNFELMEKINEIIEKVNELEIKTQVTKWYTPEIQEQLEKLEEYSIEELLNE